jgi:hypothetical protein
VQIRRAGALALALVTVAALAGQVAAPADTTADATGDRISGMGIYTENKLLLTAPIDVSRIANIGVNTMLIDTWWTIPDGTDTVQPQPYKTVDDNTLRQLIQLARSKGMRVALMPKFTVGFWHDWRGRYVPEDPRKFWNSYSAMIDHYAELANEEHVWLLFVGSEMAALDTQAREWRRVIASVRRKFPGRISYNENQDATQPTRITWWDAVDIVSTTGYFPLTTKRSPTVGDLVEGWKRRGLPKLIDMAATTGKPVMLGEVGYMATSFVGKQPYDGTEYDYRAEMQLRAYRALLQTLYQYSWYAGEFWWSWNGNDYRTPKDKPAEDLLKAWYRFGWRPDSPAPPFIGFPLPLPTPLPQLP